MHRDHVLNSGVIRRCHERQLYAGATHTLAVLRHQYWMPKRRSQTGLAENDSLDMQLSGGSRCICPYRDGLCGGIAYSASQDVKVELILQVTTARVMEALRRFIVRRGRPESCGISSQSWMWSMIWYRPASIGRLLLREPVHGRLLAMLCPLDQKWLRKILGKALFDKEELRTTFFALVAVEVNHPGWQPSRRILPQWNPGSTVAQYSAAIFKMVVKMESRIPIGVDARTESNSFSIQPSGERLVIDHGGQHPASALPDQCNHGTLLQQRWH
ncbi:hypothetical protein T4E_5868 [Trichinella pseudospiralis]|uniref:Integrase zinc-binding domain-containing protein n=1 Tax=Trichinella pseudospiralis TaxID=6337 RepID=A0A0V0XQ00_TRIPS|nr:hypothetical protein T4E_5868 [Trichinella pseudospiralis]